MQLSRSAQFDFRLRKGCKRPWLWLGVGARCIAVQLRGARDYLEASWPLPSRLRLICLDQLSV